MALIGSIFVKIGNNFADTKGLGMERRLRNESIRSWNPKKPCNASREAKQEQIPMKTSRLTKRKLGTLSD